MNKIQLHLLSFIFAAFLPPKTSVNDGEEEEDYYTILGLAKNSCSKEDIRKAYKKKSLQYHPDKVAQFARNHHNKTPAEIQADFVKIKEAYDILSDQNKRNAYDVLGPEGAKMFGSEGMGGIMDPNVLAMNLASASFVNKTKLFLLVLLAVGIILLSPILICTKIDSVYHDKEDGWLYNAKWVYILIPIWIFNTLIILLSLISQAWFPALKMFCIFILELLLSLRWDYTITWSYGTVLIPLFVQQFLALIESFVTIRRIRHDVARMVTISYLEEKILPTFSIDDDGDDQAEDANNNEPAQKRYYNDLTEEEKEFINELYIIVGANDDPEEDEGPFYDEEKGENDDDGGKKIDPEIKVLFDIAESTEFKYASYAKKDAERYIFKLIVTRLPFLVLLVLQLDMEKGWDWNLVFCTIWVEVIMETLTNCFICCCHGDVVMPSSSSDDIIYDDASDENDDDKNEDEVVRIDMKMGNEDPPEKITVSKEKVKTGEEDSKEAETGFTPASFSPLINTDNDNDESSHLKKNEDATKIDEDEVLENEKTEEESVDEEHVSTDPEVLHRRSQAIGRCCNNICIIIFLSMFVVKLNSADDESDNSGNFSAFWMIFPLLLFAGCIVCFCGLCIYSGVNQEQVDNIMRKSGVKKPREEKEGDREDGATPIVVEDTNNTPTSPQRNDFDDLD